MSTSASKNHYPDEALPDPTLYIRLLSFDSSAPENVLRLTMTQHLLQGDLKFNAISYEWGDCFVKHTVWVNYQPFEIYDNLFAFLKRLQHSSYGQLPFFADAICIDQMYVQERNSQVQSMGRIYRGVQCCLAWLGEACEESDLIFDLFHQEREWTVDLEHVYGFEAVGVPEIDSMAKGYALETIFQRRYWSRLWIIQETFLPPRVTFFCGGKTMTMGTLIYLGRLGPGTLSRLDIRSSTDEDKRAIRGHVHELLLALTNRDEYQRSVRRYNLDLAHLITHFKYAKCRDIRDKVFGLLGIAQDADQQNLDGRIVVDYDMSIFELFIHVLSTSGSFVGLPKAGRLFEALELRHDHDAYIHSGDPDDLIAALPSSFANLTFKIQIILIGKLGLKIGLNEAKATKGIMVNGARLTQYTLSVDKRPSDSSVQETEWLMLYGMTCVCEDLSQMGDEAWWFEGSRSVMIKQLNRLQCVQGILVDRIHNDDDPYSSIEILDRYKPVPVEYSTAFFECTEEGVELRYPLHLRDYMMLLEHAFTAYPDPLRIHALSKQLRDKSHLESSSGDSDHRQNQT